MKPTIDQDKCIGCGACASVCPVEPKVMAPKEDSGSGKKYVIVHPEVCDFGRACERACPTGAFKII